jgi:hypothetical protein
MGVLILGLEDESERVRRPALGIIFSFLIAIASTNMIKRL